MGFVKLLGYMAIGLAVLIAVGPFLVPVPPLEDTVAPAALADSNSRFRDVGGLMVHHKVVGEGAPGFVLLHGFGASVFSFRELTDTLGRWGTALAFDRPPFGLTDRPLSWAGPNPYSQEAQVALTVAMMDALDIRRGVLVGHSAGGTVALQVAQRHPERVEALVLVSPAVGERAALPPATRWLLATPQARRLAPLFLRAVEEDFDDLLREAWHDPERITPEIFEGYRKPLMAHDWDRGLWELTLAAASTQEELPLDELRIPTLLITGDDDRIVPTRQTEQLAEALPDAELIVIPDCGHMAHEEYPELVLEAMETFLLRRGLLDAGSVGAHPSPQR